MLEANLLFHILIFSEITYLSNHVLCVSFISTPTNNYTFNFISYSFFSTYFFIVFSELSTPK